MSDKTPAPFNVRDYAKVEDRTKDRDPKFNEGRTWYAVDPSAIYPAALKAMGVSEEDYKLATTLRSQIPDKETEKLAKRAAILNKARIWWTAKLHEAHGGKPMGIHITRCPLKEGGACEWRD